MNCHAVEVKSYKTIMFDMDAVEGENDLGEICFTLENKIDAIMNAHGSQGTGSVHQESHDIDESATPSSVISSQWGDKIVDENGIQLQTRNTTNQIMQYKDGDTSFDSEYKVDIIANSHGSRGTDSIPQESHDVDESATTISVISSQHRE